MLNVDEITTTKIAQNAVMVEESGKETIKTNLSIPIDPVSRMRIITIGSKSSVLTLFF